MIKMKETMDELHIKELEDYRTGMQILSLRDKYDNIEFSKLTYSKNPIVTYTADKNPEHFIFIEWLDTPNKYRGKGYASKLLSYLKNKYPSKVLIANANSYSKNILQKYGVVET